MRGTIAAAQPVPGTTDLMDLRVGAFATGTSAVIGGSDINNMLGSKFGTRNDRNQQYACLTIPN